jgi:hypothetical protein
MEKKKQNPPEAKAMLKMAILAHDKDALWLWLKEWFKLEVPRVAICKDHCAPFDFVSDYIFGNFKDAIVLANRSGGKTMDFGILDTLMSFLMDKTEVATVAAIQTQAKRGYQYFRQFASKFPFDSNIVRHTMDSTSCVNESVVQVITGTMSGVNSPHPQLLFLDEIDLMQWQILQQALSMPQSKHGIDARTVLTSTRKFGAGPMQRLIEEKDNRDYAFYQWCIWEVVEKLPTDRILLDRIAETFGTLPMGIEKVDGYYPWKDILSKYKNLDRETWETEWLCLRPGMEGIIYGSAYSDDNNLIEDPNWTPLGKGGHFYLTEDFGSSEDHPDVILLLWVPESFDRIVVVDEIYMTKYGTDQIWDSADEMLRKYGHYLPNIKQQIAGNVEGWSYDIHGWTEAQDRIARGAPMMETSKDAERYLVANGISGLKKFLETGRLMLTQKCVNLRLELMSYKYKKNADGRYSSLPVKADDHGPDALRYFWAILGETIGAKAFYKLPPETEDRMDEEKLNRIREKREKKPINAGIFDKEW